MAKKTKARNQGQNQEQPVDSEIRRAAERIGHVPGEGDRWQRARRLDAIRALLSQGTIVDDGLGTGLTYEEVVRDAVIAQLTVLKVALTVADDDPCWNGTPIDLNAIDLSRAASVALAGTIALLENAGPLIDYVRAVNDAEVSP